MGFRISGGSYPALTRALGIQGRTAVSLVSQSVTRYSAAATSGGGQISFTNKPYVSYEGGALSFSLTRNGGASGTIAVDWSMTITEGTPTPSSGTISWNNGEAGVKTVQVQAGQVAADRSGYLVLSNPRSVSGGAAPIIVGDDGLPVAGLYWPKQVPGYTSCYPGRAGYGMQTPGGSGRGGPIDEEGTPEPEPSVFIVNTPADANTGGAITGHGADTFAGTWEWCWRHNAFPKIIVQACSGALSTGRTIPLQTGTAPRLGRVTYYAHMAPSPGFVIRNTNVSLNGASDVVLWHPNIDVGDVPSENLPAGARDCLSSGYNGGVSRRIVVINGSLKRSTDELGGFFWSHGEVTFVNCAMYEPLHDSPINHPEDPDDFDHGFGLYLGGGATAPNQSSAFTHIGCLTAHVTARGPMVSAQTFSYINNLNYNNGRPPGINADGKSVQILSTAATQANHHNFIGNGFLRGPNNQRPNLVAISVTGTYPAGSSGYAFANSQRGWAQPANQAGYFTERPASYTVSPTIHEDAIPSSFNGFSGVLSWAANPDAPTQAEWHAFIDLFDRTVGATPTHRDPRLQLVMTQMRNAVNDVVQTNQFINTNAESGGTPAVPVVVADLLAGPDPMPIGADRHQPMPAGSGFFADGSPMEGVTPFEAWAFRRHLQVTQQTRHGAAFTAWFGIRNDTTAPTAPTLGSPVVQSSSQMTVPMVTQSTDAQSGIQDHALERADGAGSTTFQQVTQGVSTGPYIITGLSAATRYRYRARGRNRAGLYSVYSSIVEADTLSGSSPYAAIDARPTDFVVDPTRTATGTGSEASPLNPTQAFNAHNPNGGPGPVYEWLPGSLGFTDSDPNSKFPRWHPAFSGSVAFPILHRTRFKASRAGVTTEQMTHIRRTGGVGGMLGVLNTNDAVFDGFSIPGWHRNVNGDENFSYSVWNGDRCRFFRGRIDGEGLGVITNPFGSTNCGAIYHQETVDCEVADTIITRVGASTGLRVHSGAEHYNCIRLNIHHCDIDTVNGTGIYQKGELEFIPTINRGNRYHHNLIRNISRRGFFLFTQRTEEVLADAAWAYQNIIRDCPEQNLWINPPVTTPNIPPGAPGGSSGFIFVNNVIAFGGFAGFAWRYNNADMPIPFHPMFIYRNNLFFGNTVNIDIEFGTWAQLMQDNAGQFDRNLYHQYTTHYRDAGGTRTFSGANQWQSLVGYLSQANDQNGLNTNPQIVDAANRNFRLQVGSPARLAGRDYLQLLGGATTAPINIGPYITADMSDEIGVRTNL